MEMDGEILYVTHKHQSDGERDVLGRDHSSGSSPAAGAVMLSDSAGVLRCCL